MNIIEALKDKKIFGNLFQSASWQAWLVFLKALFGLPIEDEAELKIFRESTGLDAPPSKRPREAYVIAGRRAGKSSVAAAIAVYLACFFDGKLKPGEYGYIFIVSVDKIQARIIRDYIVGILRSNKILSNLVEKEMTEEIRLKNRIIIMIKTASYRSIRGFTLLAVILDELAFFRSEEFANPDKEIIAAVRPGLATLPNSLLLGISTPYARSGHLYEVYQRYYGKPGPILIWRATTRTMNPLISEETINEALAEAPQAARAEWLAEFREDIESFVSREAVEACVIPRRFEIAPIADINYFGFIDPAGGGGRDSFTLAIGHKDNSGKIIIDCIRERQPPFSPEAVVAEFTEILKAYRIFKVESDRYAGEWPRERFKSQGIRVEICDKTASELYKEILPVLMSGQVELLDNKKLINQLCSLERRTRSGGRDLITHGPGAHDDLANACAGVIYSISKARLEPKIWRVSDWLPWPDIMGDEFVKREIEPVRQELVKVRMLRTQKGSPDGMNVFEYRENETYDLSRPLAEVFITEGWAILIEEVRDEEKN